MVTGVLLRGGCCPFALPSTPLATGLQQIRVGREGCDSPKRSPVGLRLVSRARKRVCDAGRANAPCVARALSAGYLLPAAGRPQAS